MGRSGAMAPLQAPQAAASTAAVALRSVTRVFGRTAGVVRASLEVAPGEVVWLRGPNGSGKSTLLRIVATALAPTYGTGAVLGHDLIRDRAAIRSRCELLGHHTRLYADLSAAENLRFAATLAGLDAAGIPAALAAVGLAGVADQRVGAFSQGMRQRVALARCALRRSDLLLLDEPYAALDHAAHDIVDGLISDARGRGGTVLLATHEPPDPGLVDRVVAMDGGTVVR